MSSVFSYTVQLTASAATLAGNTNASSTGWTVTNAVAATVPMMDWIVISPFSLGATVGLWVLSDGAAATVGGASCIFLPAGMVAPYVISNLQPQQNWNVQQGTGSAGAGTGTYYDGNEQSTTFNTGTTFGVPVNDQSESYARTAQSGMTGQHLWTTAPNFLSVIPSASATGVVTVTFQ